MCILPTRKFVFFACAIYVGFARREGGREGGTDGRPTERVSCRGTVFCRERVE